MTGLPPAPLRRALPPVRFVMIGLCLVGLGLSYVDRINLAIAAPFIRKELDLSNDSMGVVLGAFFWTYALLQIPAGWFIDRVGVRLGFAVSVVWWSLFTMLTGLARGTAAMFGARLLLGVGEAGAAPACVKAVYTWFPRSERGLAAGIFDAGPRAGTAVALPIVTACISVWGWRASFYVTGLIGFVWLAAWLLVYREPEASTLLTEAQRETLLRERAAPAGKGSVYIRRLFRHRMIWAMMLGHFCFNFVNYFFITWFPSYLVQAKGFTLGQLGTLGAVPALMAIPGSVLGGWASDELHRRGWSLTAARKTCIIAGLLAASIIVLGAFTDSTGVTVLLFSFAYASLSFVAANLWALPADVAPAAGYVATIGGITNFAANLAGAATAGLTGVMLTVSGGSFFGPLALASLTCLVASLIYGVLMPTIRPLWAEHA